ncbi:hypothetical protein H0H92_006905, partial [Tricholoma furcatifolium]
MSSRKSSQTLTQGKLNFGAAKPKRASTHNAKSKTRVVSTPRKVEDTPEPIVQIDVSSSSSEEESSPKVAKQDATKPEKESKETQLKEFTTALRPKSNIENSEAPTLNVKDRKSYEFGPCVGVSRLERWERAHLLGLNPPKEVKDILTAKEGLEQEEYS